MNKYKAKKQEYNGHTYDSKREAAYAQTLDLMIKSGDVIWWKRQHKISIDVGDVHICNYFIDFQVSFSDGRLEFHEVKGFETAVWKLKWKLTKALFPDYDLVIIK